MNVEIRVGAAVLLAALACGSTCRAGTLPVYVYVDVSPSARSGEATQVLKTFTHGLSSYTGEADLDIKLVPFFEDAFMAEPVAQVTLRGNHPTECRAASGEIFSISRSYADARQKQCDLYRAQVNELAASGRLTEISKLSAAIGRLAELKLPGRCTAVNAMIKRAVREKPNGVAIVISDMESSCPTPEAPSDFRAENQTFLIPIGSRQHSIEERFDAIQTKYARAMPWVQVIESFRLQVIMNAIVHPGPLISVQR